LTKDQLHNEAVPVVHAQVKLPDTLGGKLNTNCFSSWKYVQHFRFPGRFNLQHALQHRPEIVFWRLTYYWYSPMMKVHVLLALIRGQVFTKKVIDMALFVVKWN